MRYIRKLILLLLKRFKSFFKPKSAKKPEKKVEEIPDNVIYFHNFVNYRLKFNPETQVYEKVVIYEECDIE